MKHSLIIKSALKTYEKGDNEKKSEKHRKSIDMTLSTASLSQRNLSTNKYRREKRDGVNQQSRLQEQMGAQGESSTSFGGRWAGKWRVMRGKTWNFRR